MTRLESHNRLTRPFYVLWISASVSTLGDGIRMAALPLVAALVTDNPTAVAAVAFSGQVPWFLTSLAAGAVADRTDRRRLMWIVDTFRALVMLGLAAMIVFDVPTIIGLCLVAFALGVGQTLFDSAAQALLPNVVERALLPTANSRLATTRITINSFVGPPVGGLLFGLSASLPFLIDAASFAAAAALIGLVLGFNAPAKPPRTEQQARKSIRSDIGEGIRWLMGHKVLRSIVLLIAAVNFTQAATQSILVLYALHVLQLEPIHYGWLLAASGIGGIIGGLSGGKLRSWIPHNVLFATTVLVCIPIFLVIGLTSNAFVAGTMIALNTFAGITAEVMLQTLRQYLVPNELMARVSSAIGFVAVGIALPLGTLIGGAVANFAGLRAPFFMSAAILAVASLTVPRISRMFAEVHANAIRKTDDEFLEPKDHDRGNPPRKDI